MHLLIAILFLCLCFGVPPVLCWKGKVGRLTVFFWWFFGITSIVNAFLIKILYADSSLDSWMELVGPALVQIPFAFMIYALERTNRKPLYALLVAVLGSFLVTGLWLLSSALFMR